MRGIEIALAMKANRNIGSNDLTSINNSVIDHENRLDAIEALMPKHLNITSDYTVLYGNYSISADATSGNITVTFPTASLVPARTYSITKVDTSSSYVRITSTSLLADEVYHDLLFANESLTFFSNGSTWEIK